MPEKKRESLCCHRFHSFTSNHSLYQIKLFCLVFLVSILLSLGKLRGKPAIRRFDWSFAALLKSYEQFARQYRFIPPSVFPLTLDSSSKDHLLSGPSIVDVTQIYRERARMIALLTLFKIGEKCTRSTLRPRARFLFSSSLSLRIAGFHHLNTLHNGRLLGPCYKTGQMKSFLV